MSTTADTYDDLDRFVTADVACEYDPEVEARTAADVGDVERRLRRIRYLRDQLSQVEQVAKDDISRVQAWLHERSEILLREIEWFERGCEMWARAHAAETGTRTVNLPSGTLKLSKGRERIEPLTKEPAESVPAQFVRTKREFDKASITKQTAPGPLAEGVEAPAGFVAHWAVTPDGERIPDVVRLVPVEDSFSVKVPEGF